MNPSDSQLPDPLLQPFRVELADFKQALTELRAVRDQVFVIEQNVPEELEHDARDPLCTHVIARLQDGTPIGTGRLTTDRHIGRMAVLAAWRGRGVGDALLLALVEQVRLRGWHDVHLNAQVSALGFYERHGFHAEGERFMEAGIEHQAMRRTLDGPRKIERQQDAVETVTGIITAAGRSVWIRSFKLDPGLLDAPEVMQALRTFATSGRGNEVRILLQDATSPQTNHAPLLALAQRLPSVFLFRELLDKEDRVDASAWIASDAGGYYLRKFGERIEGEAELNAPARCRQLRASHNQAWERARPVTEYRALGL